MLANKKTTAAKLLILEKIDLKLQIIKILIRLCLDAKIIDLKKYILWEEKILEIGRMLGGWIKTAKEKPRQ